jgi:endonuclease/exonuclease/phosphatase family metal-dependent hydrolase
VGGGAWLLVIALSCPSVSVVMTGIGTYALENLENHASFNFLSTLSDSDPESDFLDSPYSHHEIVCNYVDESQFVNTFCNLKNIAIMTFNIQSISAKFHEFSEMINQMGAKNCAPDVICLQELWQFPDHVDFTLTAYHNLVYKLRRNNVQGGGVGIFVKKNLKFKLLPEKSVFVDRVLESIFVEIEFDRNNTCIIGSVYRPGSHPDLTENEQFTQFTDLFSNICNEISACNSQSYIMGDINLNALLYDSCAKTTEFIDLLFSFGLLQVVSKPTRVTQNSATLIDHVITNPRSNSALLKSVIIISRISDHFPIVHFKQTNKIPAKQEFFESRDFSDANLKRFNDNLRSVDFGPVYESTDAQQSYDVFSKIFLELYEIFFPLVRKKLNRNVHKLEKWMSKGLLVSRNVKINLCKKSIANPSPATIEKFKSYRNLYNKLIKAAKKLFYEEEFQKEQANIKNTWKLINQIVNKKSKNSDPISSINLNGDIISDPKRIAEIFNEFFTSTYVSQNCSRHPPLRSEPSRRPRRPFRHPPPLLHRHPCHSN